MNECHMCKGMGIITKSEFSLYINRIVMKALTKFTKKIKNANPNNV